MYTLFTPYLHTVTCLHHQHIFQSPFYLTIKNSKNSNEIKASLKFCKPLNYSILLLNYFKYFILLFNWSSNFFSNTCNETQLTDTPAPRSKSCLEFKCHWIEFSDLTFWMLFQLIVFLLAITHTHRGRWLHKIYEKFPPPFFQEILRFFHSNHFSRKSNKLSKK